MKSTVHREVRCGPLAEAEQGLQGLIANGPPLMPCSEPCGEAVPGGGRGRGGDRGRGAGEPGGRQQGHATRWVGRLDSTHVYRVRLGGEVEARSSPAGHAPRWIVCH